MGTFSDVQAKLPDLDISGYSSEQYNTWSHRLIMDSLTEKFEYYVNKHNRLASSMGIAYSFSLPLLDDDSWSSTIRDPSILALFQGYPYGAGTNDVYNKVAFGGAKIEKGSRYYVREDSSSGILAYHKRSCPQLAGLTEDELSQLQSFRTKQECAEHGAFYCTTCNP